MYNFNLSITSNKNESILIDSKLIALCNIFCNTNTSINITNQQVTIKFNKQIDSTKVDQLLADIDIEGLHIKKDIITKKVTYGIYPNKKLIQMSKGLDKKYMKRLAVMDQTGNTFDKELVYEKVYTDGDEELLSTFTRYFHEHTGLYNVNIQLEHKSLAKDLGELRKIKDIIL